MGLSLKPRHVARYMDIARLIYRYSRIDVGTDGDAGVGSNGSASAEASAGVRGVEGAGGAGGSGGEEGEVSGAKAEELAGDLERMGPVFIKIGQLLSTRPDVLPLPYVEALARLQDKVEPFPFVEIEQIVRHELGLRLTRAFSYFDPVPVSAASLGQVHRAAMRDGRPVAVKVQRAHIHERMMEDLECLHEITEFLDQHTAIGRRYEFERIWDDFRKTLLRELDYRLEAQNLKTLGANLSEFSRIVVPQPVDDYTTSRVLTMQFINGHKITALSPLIRTEIDGLELAEQLFQAYLKQILVDGFFHADPHPGNILLTDDGRLALVDLGMVGHLSASLRVSLLRIVLAISDGRSEDAAGQMIAISEKMDDFDPREFERQVADLIGRNRGLPLQQVAVGRVVMEMYRLAADCGIRAPSEISTLGKTLLNLDEVGSTLNPKFNPNESIRRNATSILQRQLIGGVTKGNLYSSLLEAKEFVQNLPARVAKIMDLVGNNELEVKVNALDENKLMAGFQKVANRISAGLIMAALIIGAALLTRVDTPTRIFGYPAIATIFFILAACGGIILIIRIVMKDEPL